MEIELRELSKLQIRAEVMLMLQQLRSLDEMSKDQQDKCVNQLRTIKDIDYVLDVLVKEFARVDYKKGQVISLFLQELGDLESLREVLWSYVKSPNSSDELKDLAGITLKSLGDQTDPEEFLNYLENPKDLVDKETQKLLETASVNPEAQIDFLDFMFSLPEEEQINLIISLKEDYSSEHLVSIVVPALETNPSPKIEEELVKILGETRSPFAVPALSDVLKYSKSDMLKKQAQKSLSMLKLAGININQEVQIPTVSPITKVSDVYECHTNIIDGTGNQGLIISRVKPNQDILMMNVVINDISGIVDCFGFYGISKQDFSRIIERFQDMTTRFPVTPEYCKLKLAQAEKINKENNLPVPYEYAAWKSILSDISPIETNFEELSEKWVSKDLINETALLCKFPDFQHWFLEEDDHPEVKALLDNLINEACDKEEYFKTNKQELKKWLELNIDKLFKKVFNDEVKNIYRKRLLDITYLLNVKDLEFFRKVAASLAWSLNPENGYDIATVPFFRELGKRTIIEGFLRYQYKINNESDKKIVWGSKKRQSEKPTEKPVKIDLKEIIEIFCEENN